MLHFLRKQKSRNFFYFVSNNLDKISDKNVPLMKLFHAKKNIVFHCPNYLIFDSMFFPRFNIVITPDDNLVSNNRHFTLLFSSILRDIFRFFFVYVTTQRKKKRTHIFISVQCSSSGICFH